MKNLKIRMYFILGIIIFFSIIFSSKSNAVSSATYFYGEPISIEKSENIKIISNEVTIDTEKSKIENKFLIKNVSDKEVISKIFIKLEDRKIATSINNLKIKVNKTEITNVSKEDEKYVIDVRVPANEGKRIEILYNTDNNLRDAKVLKYTLDNLKGQNLKYFKIDIMLPEIDVPLVMGIYPECYKFDNNTVSVEYYDFNVNSLTKDFIIEKQTYKNLLYGKEFELSDKEKEIINNAEDLIKNGIVSDYSKYYVNNKAEPPRSTVEKILREKLKMDEDTIKKITYEDDNDKGIKSIIYYSLAKVFSKKNLTSKYSFDFPYNIREDWKYPLTSDYIDKVCKDICPLYGLTIAVDYIRSEGDKELYVYKNVSESGEDYIYDCVKFSEWDILRTKDRRMWYDYENRRGLKTIHINQDITGAEIQATDEEKIEYINMINPSLYARFTIYDGGVKNGKDEYNIRLATGYYGKENLPIAKQYNIVTEEMHEYYERNAEDSIYIDYDNDIVAKKCKVPNLAHNVGYRVKEKGKYIINFFEGFYHADGYGNIVSAVNCDRAKEMKKENEIRLSEVEKQVKNEISSIKINYDIKEEQEISDKIENDYVKNNEIAHRINSLSKTDKNIYGIITAGILILIIVIMILLVKRGKSNERR